MQQRSERYRGREFPRQTVLYLVVVASKQQATHTVRAEAMTEARVCVQHMHVAFLAPISLFACATFLSFVGKHIEDII